MSVTVMNKIRLFSFTLLILLFGKDLYSQKIFREGFIVLKTGQVLKGMIEYSANQGVPSTCAFKRFDIARRVVYSPDDITMFGYNNGNRYESKRLNGRNAFYEVIITGEITLYRKRSKFFIEKNNSGFVELKNGPSILENSGERKEFKNLAEFLTYITGSKAGSISQKFNLKNEILPLIASYNRGSGNSYYIYNRFLSEKQLSQQSITTEAFRNRFGVLSGLNVYNLKLIPIWESYVPNPEKETAIIYGLSYERLLLNKSDKLSLRIDLLLNKQTFYCYEEKRTTSYQFARNEAFFEFTGIKVPLLIQYSLTGHKIVPYVNAGLAYQYFTNGNFLQIEEIETHSNVVNTIEKRDYSFKNGELTATGGIGLRMRIFNNLNLSLEGRIESGSGIFLPVVNLTYMEKFEQSSFQSSVVLGITF